MLHRSHTSTDNTGKLILNLPPFEVHNILLELTPRESKIIQELADEVADRYVILFILYER